MNNQITIGLTYDLREHYIGGRSTEDVVELVSSVAQIEAIEGALHALGYKTARIGDVFQLQERLTKGERWDLVFDISEGFYGRSRSGQIPGLLDAHQIPYTFSDTTTTLACTYKEFAKRIVRDGGIPTPRFAVIESKSDLDQVSDQGLRYPLFVKPVAEGSSKGVYANSKIDDPDDLWSRCEAVIEKFTQPALVEEFMPGREITVGIVGTGDEARVLGAAEVIVEAAFGGRFNVFDERIQDGIASLAAKFNDCMRVKLVDDVDAKRASVTALKAYRALRCRDCARIDMRLDVNGVPHFLDCNPKPGIEVGVDPSLLVVINEAVGNSFQDLIGMIVGSARKRKKFGSE